MHVLVVIYKTGAEYQFFFKDVAKARKFKSDFSDSATRKPGDLFGVVDEHGKEGVFESAAISGVIVIDLEGKVSAEIEANLISARGEARLQNAAKTDPVLQGVKNLVVPGR